MNTQPKTLCESKNMPTALRLADWLEDQYDPTHNQEDAAAELRRLHKEIGDWDRVCDQHLKHIDKLKKRMKRAEALNQELLKALIDLTETGAEAWGEARPCVRIGLAAIAKAEGQA